MNLFWLDTDPTLAAQAHQDVHVDKMLLKGVQLLCTAFLLPGPATVLSRPAHKDPVYWSTARPEDRIIARQLPYARTEAQYNHPCAVWTRASRGNFDAVIALCQALAAEYRYRFDKVHASEAALAWVIHHRSAAQVPDGPMTPYALAMPVNYRNVDVDSVVLTMIATGAASNNAVYIACVAAYRAYYRAEKRGHWQTKRAGLGRRALAAVGIGSAADRVWVPAKWTRRNPPEWFIL